MDEIKLAKGLRKFVQQAIRDELKAIDELKAKESAEGTKKSVKLHLTQARGQLSTILANCGYDTVNYDLSDLIYKLNLVRYYTITIFSQIKAIEKLFNIESE